MRRVLLCNTHLDVTADHPFWVEKLGWVESDDLQPGMLVLALDEKRHGVQSLEPTGRVERAYKLEVADFHTYFVGDEDIWVHNCPVPTSRAVRRQAMRDAVISMSQQPVSQSRNASEREYTYDIQAPGGGTQPMSGADVGPKPHRNTTLGGK